MTTAPSLIPLTASSADTTLLLYEGVEALHCCAWQRPHWSTQLSATLFLRWFLRTCKRTEKESLWQFARGMGRDREGYQEDNTQRNEKLRNESCTLHCRKAGVHFNTQSAARACTGLYKRARNAGRAVCLQA